MARRRVSRLQKRILRLLVAEQRRTRGGAASSHYELVKALGGDKGNISHSLRTLEERGMAHHPSHTWWPGQFDPSHTRRAEKCLGNLKKVVIKMFV